jgi:hypothetical protein
MNVGEIWSALRIDGAQAKKDAAKAGSEAGATAGKSAGTAIKKGMAVLGGAISGALSIALVGRFAALERAQAEFRRETGATAEEAERAGKAINAMAGRNLQSIEEIGLTLTKVHTDLGLTGEAAEAAAESFLRFGRATAQDASEAVLAFDDILDAWGLTAEDAAGIMDQLVASHQEYGGSIEDNQRALALLAPALKANNVSFDEGVGLLNLFAASGLDATKAQTAFNTAITKLPPGTDLMTFLETLQGIEDPTIRAREAVKVFGSRAGAGLANALGPGKGALSDFVITAEEVPGATDKAADASLTMVDRIKQAFSGFVSGTVDLLGPAGPLLTAVGSLGTLFAPLLGKAFQASVGAAKVSIAAAGTAAGAIFAGAEAAAGAGAGFLGSFAARIAARLPLIRRGAIAAASAGGAATIPLAFVGSQPDVLAPGDAKFDQWFKDLSDAAQQWNIDLARKLGDDASAAYMEGLREGVKGGLGDGILSGGGVLPEMAVDWDLIRQTGRDAVDALAEGVTSARPDLDQAYRDLVDQQAAIIRTGMRATVDRVVAGMGSMKDAVENGKAAFLERIHELAWETKHPWADDKYVTWLGNQHRKALRRSEKALENGRPGLALREKALADDFAAEMTRIKLMAAGVSESVILYLSRAFAKVGSLRTVMANAITGLFGGTPTVPKRASGGPVEAGRLYRVNELGIELFRPAMDGRIETASRTAALFRDTNAMSGRIEVVVRDPDGGLARSGISTGALASQLGDALMAAERTASTRYTTPRR